MRNFFTNSFPDLAALILRLGFGGLMLIGHGLPKVRMTTGGAEIHFYDFMGVGAEISLVLAVLAEFVCAGLIVIGLWTRVASIPLIVTMAVAAFMVHGADPLLSSQAEGGASKEFALLYMIGFLAIALLGGGKFSLGHRLKSVSRTTTSSPSTIR